MNRICSIVMLSLLLCSCGDLFLPDGTLTLQKQALSSNCLRVDGYYYTQFGDMYEIYFLYNNGVLFSGGHVFESELSQYEQKYKDGSFWNEQKDDKLYWGLFQVNGCEIKFEKWYPSSGGDMPVYLHQGEVLNDTTFIITESILSNTGEKKDLDQTYRFQYFSPKPDSTNGFI